ncbi:hypothetical protein [Reichenbachiella sp. MSK19-1]|nr:hypothetical protein [Reichenbachiella sp. MSK19-1]RJE72039.1 hypothetical protein BGP76_08150 [Reichenbachiella sp. MSK19-1]
MKKTYTIIALAILTVTGFLTEKTSAQAPEKMSYQAVVRDANNALVSNQEIGMQISILEGSIEGSTVYMETQVPTSNAGGLITLEIGSGSVISGDFTSIDWSTGSFFIKTEIDLNGGTDYTITGTSQLMSVPYALYAKTAGNAFSGDFDDLTNKPQGLGEKLTEVEVDDFVANNGYLTAEVDGSTTNEIQDLQLEGNNLTITSNGSATTIDLSPYLDNTDTQLTEAEVDAYAGNNGYLTSFTEVDGSVTNEIELPAQADQAGKVLSTDGTSPVWVSNVSTQLTEAEVDAYAGNNGYLTAEVDGSVTNEIQDLQLSGNNLTITNNGSATTIDLSPYMDDTDTQLSETEVDNFVANNGYLTSFAEVDGSVTNEIQDLQLSGNNLTITNNGSATTIDLSPYMDDTDTQLSETEVDNYVANNGYITAEVDGSVTNEIQDLQLSGNNLTITNNGSATTIDLSPYMDDTDTQLSETEVDNFVANNGYLTSFAEVDGSVTNEIQDLQLSGNNLTITNNGTATTIDLSPYLDDTDTKLTETEVDAFVANNGYITAEIDGSVTNEIQDLQLSGNNLTITNNGTATTIDLSPYLDDTDTKLTETEVDNFVANNGYLTSFVEVDGSVTNEIELPSQAGQAGKYLTSNGSGAVWSDLSISPSVRTVSANVTLTSTDERVIVTESITVTLPATPIDGQLLTLAATNVTATINGNGRTIYIASNSAPSFTFSDTSTNMYIMIYSSTQNAWIATY